MCISVQLNTSVDVPVQSLEACDHRLGKFTGEIFEGVSPPETAGFPE